MLFNSFSFLIFFLAVCSLYFALPFRFRALLLLVASYGFYSSYSARCSILLLALTIANYTLALLMDRAQKEGFRKITLGLSIVSNTGLLFLFKYCNLFIVSLNRILAPLQPSRPLPLMALLLPVGISFYTFKIMNYTIDVYRRKIPAERNFTIFALFVAFFPQLISGPIDRAAQLLPQFHQEKTFDYDRVTRGLQLMLWGFFQKLVIADSLSVLVDPVFSNPSGYQGPTLALAAVFFTFQIYCDFSGYSNIAIGAARILGYDSMDNFHSPYFSRSIPEFWRRWHISLSTWFRDYLYIPLGGKRTSLPRWYLNLFFVFLISGLWHGSNWTFVVWGSLHGLYYIGSVLTSPLRKRVNVVTGLEKQAGLHHAAQIVITFLFVAFAWIFFRAATISDAFTMVTGLSAGWNSHLSVVLSPFLSKAEFIVGLGSLSVLGIARLLSPMGNIGETLSLKPRWLRWTLYYSGIFSILLFGNIGAKPFIYFQF